MQHLSLFVILLLVPFALSDTPANCSYEDARGTWSFKVWDHPVNSSAPPTDEYHFELLYPNLVRVVSGLLETGGYWTLIYNQGFEFTVAHRKWLVMFDYGPNGESYCDRSKPGHTHDVLRRQWRFFTARKISQTVRREPVEVGRLPNLARYNQLYTTSQSYVDEINAAQQSWTALRYPHLDQLTIADVVRRAGGIKSKISKPPVLIDREHVSEELLNATHDLPESFDWRHPGQGMRSPVTPIRSQGNCGSCYAFASAAALESRVRLLSNFTREPILSPQDVVDCSPYSEGCDGGFPYLVAGKYAEDFGFAEESCDPYTGKKADHCPTKEHCKRYYATNYRYVGGYYGACSELLMKMELVRGGPFPVGFEVYEDFRYYKSGVYSHTGLQSPINRFEPFELTNHAVLLVGYGVDAASKLPYWVVKNSWGPGWGEDGFFRILRGSDECAIESLGVVFDPVL